MTASTDISGSDVYKIVKGLGVQGTEGMSDYDVLAIGITSFSLKEL